MDTENKTDWRWVFLAGMRKRPSAELCAQRGLPIPFRFSQVLRDMKRGALLFAVVGIGSPLFAQEALFRSLDAERTAVQMRNQVEEAPYTTRWKDLRIQVTPSLSLEWKDNVELTERLPEDDLILTPKLDLHAFHPIGEANMISVDLGVGYAKYLDHEELDRLTIEPGSSLSFDLFIKDFAFNFHERLTYQLDPALVAAAGDTAEFGGIDNTVGILSTWNLNKVSLNLGYDYVRFISSSSQFEHLNRNSHPVLMRAGFRIHPASTLGVEATANPTAYDLPVQNDRIGYSAGGYAQFQVSEHVAIVPRAGYSLHVFSPNETGFDPDDHGAFYFGLTFDHRPNETVSYRFTANREINPGIDANLSDVLKVELDTTWRLVRELPLLAAIFYEDGKQTAGLQTEQFDRIGGSLTLNYQLTQRANVSMAYGLVMKQSDMAERDYLQNRVTLTLGYRL